MIQDILKEIEDVDLLVTSSVWNEEGKEPSIFDCSIELTYRDPETGDLYSYIALPLDTCKIMVEKNKLYDAKKDEDLCSEVEFEDDRIEGFLQWRRATYAERMTFIRKYNESKDTVCNVAKFLNIPACLAPCQELWDRLYQNPMTIHFPDYGDKALIDLFDSEEDKDKIAENMVEKFAEDVKACLEHDEQLISDALRREAEGDLTMYDGFLTKIKQNK